MVQVGMYWLNIKGRFGNQKSRTYLSMKYGYRWLYRVRVAKMMKAKSKTAKKVPSKHLPKLAGTVTSTTSLLSRETPREHEETRPLQLDFSFKTARESQRSENDNQQRLAEIERVLLSFKQRKALLTELL